MFWNRKKGNLCVLAIQTTGPGKNLLFFLNFLPSQKLLPHSVLVTFLQRYQQLATVVEEVVLQDLLDRDSLFGIDFQELLNQRSSLLVGNVRKLETKRGFWLEVEISYKLLIKIAFQKILFEQICKCKRVLFWILAPKKQGLPSEEFSQDAPQTPHVHFQRIFDITRFQQLFGSPVEQCCNRFHSFGLFPDFKGAAEVPNNDTSLIGEKNVWSF